MKLGQRLRARIFLRDGHRCRACGREANGLLDQRVFEIDHIIPRVHGGLSTEVNLQVLCTTCNAVKGTRMPNRMIRESARTSQTLDQLSDGAERMFWRLTTVADDFGRFEADPRVLLAACFPLRVGRLKVERVEKWLLEMILVELVTRYQVAGKVYGFFATWDKHQRVRAQHSKYPAPSDDNMCGHPRTDASESRESKNPRVEEPESRESKGDAADVAANGHWGNPEDLIALYNRLAPPGLARVTRLSPARRDKAVEYLKKFPEQAFWMRCFSELKFSKLLLGLKPSPGHEHFRGEFDWLLTKGSKDQVENCLKVAEGKYHDAEERR